MALLRHRRASDGHHAALAGTRARATVPLAKPPVRKLARDLGIDLRAVDGTGPGGVITRDDVRAAATAHPRPERADRRASGTRREPIRGVRRATAAAMVASAFTAPHVTEFLAVDVTATMALRDRLRAAREYADVAAEPARVRRQGRLPGAAPHSGAQRAVGRARRARSSTTTGCGSGSPRPRRAACSSRRSATPTRSRCASWPPPCTSWPPRPGPAAPPPADLTGGTFTITNVGVFGVDSGTPILNPGEAGILAVGAIKEAPWVVDGALAVRTVCQLALSFDHRLVDGEQGSRFLADVGALLTDPGLALTW